MVPAAPFSIHRNSTELDVWSTEEIDIGVTSVIQPGKDKQADNVLMYETSLRFPHVGRLWRVQRSLAEFTALHSTLQSKYPAALYDRNIHVPHTPRLVWDFGTSADSLSHQMMMRLNVYLRKLLEIEAIHQDRQFQAFLTPHPTSTGDMEIQGKMLPAIALTPSASSKMKEIQKMKTLHVPTEFSDNTPPVVSSQCGVPIYFGAGIQLRAFGGLRVGLVKRSGLTGSQKAVALAAGVAGVALTGPLSAMLALGALGGGAKHQLNKSYYLSLNKATNNGRSMISEKHGNGSFIVENAELLSGPRRPLKYGDLIHLFCRNVRKNVGIGQPPDSKRGHLTIINSDSKAATLRLISPYGLRGNVVCGSPVYMQLLNSP